MCKPDPADLGGVIREYDVFSDRPKTASVEPHKIELTDKMPVRYKPYPVPHKLEEAVRNKIAVM